MSIHKNYTALSDTDRETVDEAYNAVRASLVAAGHRVSNSDPAERLVEAIATYIVESRPKEREPYDMSSDYLDPNLN